MLNLIELVVLTLVNSGSAFLVIILLSNSASERLSRWLTVMTVMIVGWVNFAYLGYVETDSALALLFYRVNGAFVAAFLYAEYMFYIDVFLKLKLPFLKWGMAAISASFVFLILFTNSVISDAVWQAWGNEITFGPVSNLFSGAALALNLLVIVLLILRYFKFNYDERRKAVLFLIGTFLFIIFNIVFNVASPEILQTARYQHFGDYSAIFFLIFTTLAIWRRQFLNVKVALTAFLISVVSTLLLIDILILSRSLLERGVKMVLFTLFIGVSILLVRSVLNEIKQREEVARINKQLRDTNVALDGALSEVQEARRKERDMMDVMGHELRTPLTVVRNALSVLQTEINKSGNISKERLDKYLGMALESARREVTLVETLLSATKVDASRLQLDMTRVPVSEVIQNALESQKDIIEEKELKVRNLDLTKELYIFTDRVRVQEIMDNFLSNAAKYTPSRGSIEINVWRAKQKVWIQVKDTGFGISPEDLVNLGKKFFRAQHHIDGEGMVRPGGTGLGLYVTFELIRIMGGELYIQSTVGKGTAFTFGLSEFENQKEHQFDQTFDAGNAENRQHVFLNEEPPYN